MSPRSVPAEAAATGHGTPRGGRMMARGSSLVELVLTLAISSVIVLTLYGFLMTQAVVSLDENSELSTQNSVRQGAQQLFDELEICKPRRLDSMGAWFEYYLPQTGPGGGFVLDASGNLTYGVTDANGQFYLNGFYCITFIRSNESQDLLVESTLHLSASDPGTDLNGNGTTTDIFVGGVLQIAAYDANGFPLGMSRNLTGKFYMQLNPNSYAAAYLTHPTNPALNYTNVDSANLTVFPMQGIGDPVAASAAGVNSMPYTGWGIFLMRQVNGVNAQKADAFVDYNGNGVRDNFEPYIDSNGNGVYDPADSEPFSDTNGNNVKDPSESYVDSNHNAKYDCRMTLNLVTFKPGRTVTESAQQRDKATGLKFLSTTIRFKNLP